MKKVILAAALVLSNSLFAHAAGTAKVTMRSLMPAGDTMGGSVTLTDTSGGLSIMVDIPTLPAGEHGFHVHQNGDCGPGDDKGKIKPGFAAGPHFDPGKSGHHLGPAGGGHKGDIPKLVIADRNVSSSPLLAPQLKLADIRGRSLIIHEGGDNYSDNPENGGGAGRLMCGVIPNL
jgi:superoxide dismutase, Cu-Zn family